MKKALYLIVFFLILSSKGIGQIAYYDAIKIMDGDFQYYDTIKKLKITPDDDALKILGNYVNKKSMNRIDVYNAFKNNPFFQIGKISKQPQDKVMLDKINIDQLGGLDVTTLAQGISQFMIERAKQELNVAFFEKFKKFAEENDEIKYLFPVTTKRLSYLLSYHYSEMLTQLRDGFYEDLNNLPDNVIKFLEESNDFKKLRDTEPEFIIAINSIKLFRQMEYLSPTELINQLPNLTYGADSAYKHIKDNLNKRQSYDNFESILKLTAIFSEALQDTSDNRHWVSSKDFNKNIFNDQVTRTIFMGLIYQQIKNETIKINGKDICETMKGYVEWYNKRVSEFIYLTNKVDFAYHEIKNLNKENEKFKNDHIYSYINTTLEIAEFGNQFIEKYSTNKIALNDYFTYARDANNIYKYTYQKNYSSALMASVDLFEKIVPYQAVNMDRLEGIIQINEEYVKSYQDSTNNKIRLKRWAPFSNKDSIIDSLITCKIKKSDLKRRNKKIVKRTVKEIKKNLSKNNKLAKNQEKNLNYRVDSIMINKDQIYDQISSIIAKKTEAYGWLKDLNTYGTFMANMVEADSPEEVQNILNSTALPAGSSSIKKNSKFNIAIGGYLGASMFNKQVFTKDTGFVWNSKVTVTAPIGVSFSLGLQPSWFPKMGSITTTLVLFDIGAIVDYQLSDDATSVESKITLENIFSPGIFLSYGLAWNIPISIGANFQYGPGLFKIDDNNTAVVNSPSWRIGFTIAVDIPFYNLYNSPRK